MHDNDQLNKKRHEQLLKLVSKSFINELLKIGVDKSDVVTVTLHLLDHVIEKGDKIDQDNSFYSNIFNFKDIKNEWGKSNRFGLDEVSISPLNESQVQQICKWLKNENIKNTLIDFLPKTEEELFPYLFRSSEQKYFAVFFGNQFVGFIGGEKIDTGSRKLEMKKIIGAPGFRGKGIGKKSTFLYLYYVFTILKFNKVYIRTLDTNIKNINLNSKFGFELTGILFQDVFLNNEFHDVVQMALLNSRWSNIFQFSKKSE